MQPSCNLFNCDSSVFTNQLQGSFFIPRGRGCNWTSEALCIHHTRAAIFEHFNPLIDDSTRELYPNTEHTCGDEFVLPAHLLPTKSI